MGAGASALEGTTPETNGNRNAGQTTTSSANSVHDMVHSYMNTQVRRHIERAKSPVKGSRLGVTYKLDPNLNSEYDDISNQSFAPYGVQPLHLSLRAGSKSVILLERVLSTGTGTSTGSKPSKNNKMHSAKSLRSMALKSHSSQKNVYISPSDLIATSTQMTQAKTRIETPLGSQGSNLSNEKRDSRNNSSNSMDNPSLQNASTPKGSASNLLPQVSSGPGTTPSIMPVHMAGKGGLTIITSASAGTGINTGEGTKAIPGSQDSVPDKVQPAKRPQLKLQVSAGNIDDADWIQVSDDEGEEENVPAKQRLSLSLLNHTAQQSYMLTKSGTIFVEGFTGAIGKGGINATGGSGSALLPMQDRLVFLCRLGSGASGVVYKALDLKDMRLVALKMIPVFDKAKRRQMVRELSALFQLLHQRNQLLLSTSAEYEAETRAIGVSSAEAIKDVQLILPAAGAAVDVEAKASQMHGLLDALEQGRPSDYIVDFYDAFSNVDEGDVGLMMEYMDGGSLQDIVLEGGCDNETTLASIAAQALVGLTFLHQCNQLHRDIKPGNFLITKRGFVKIADFGILRQMNDISNNGSALQPVQEASPDKNNSSNGEPESPTPVLKKVEGSDIHRAQTFVGTATYMSPERIDGREYSYPSDIWSFGLSLLTIALGKLPIDTQGGYWTILHHIRDCEPPKVPDDFSNEFQDFIACCLQKNADDRMSAAELLQHPFLRCAAAENDTEGDEERGRSELSEILWAVVQHLEKRKHDHKKYPQSLSGKEDLLPGTLAYTLARITQIKIKDLMRQLFFPRRNDTSPALLTLAVQLHLTPAIIARDVLTFIDNLSEDDTSVMPALPVQTPKASHARK